MKVSFTHLIAWAIVKAGKEWPAMVRSFEERDGKPHLIEAAGINLGIAPLPAGPAGKATSVNPTGAVVPGAAFERGVELGRPHDLFVVHDNAYSEVCFDGYRAPSFLEVLGAKDVGVEVFSMSKSYSMPGWRIAFVVGNAGYQRGPIENALNDAGLVAEALRSIGFDRSTPTTWTPAAASGTAMRPVPTPISRTAVSVSA